MSIIRTLAVVALFTFFGFGVSCVAVGGAAYFADRGFVFLAWLVAAGSAGGACLGAWIAARKQFYLGRPLDWQEVAEEYERILGFVRRVLDGWIGTVILAVTLLALVAAVVLTAFVPQSFGDARFVCWMLAAWPFIYWGIILRGSSDWRDPFG